MDKIQHRSDCALHNEPAMPAGVCDCGAETKPAAPPGSENWTREEWDAFILGSFPGELKKMP